nr:hypothetical protein [Halohasta litchfieldiae]
MYEVDIETLQLLRESVGSLWDRRRRDIDVEPMNLNLCGGERRKQIAASMGQEYVWFDPIGLAKFEGQIRHQPFGTTILQVIDQEAEFHDWTLGGVVERGVDLSEHTDRKV